MPPKFRRKLNKNRGSGSKRKKTSGGGGGGRGAYLARTSGGTRTGRTTGRGTATSFGPAGSGSAGSGRSETERLQSQLAGAQALQRRTMAQLGAGDINKQQSKDAMKRAMSRIRQSAQGLASMDPRNTIQGNIRMSDGSRPMNAAGRARFDQIMRGVTGGKGSNFYNMSKGILKPGQNIGGTNRPQGFSPYQGKDMRMGLNKFAPISQGISRVMEKGSFLPFPLKGMAAKRYEDSIKDTPRTLADLGMGTTDVPTMAQSLRNLPEGANELRGNMEAAAKEAEMRQLRGQRFDREGEVKAAENQGIAGVLDNRGIDTTRNIPDMEDALKAQDLAGRAVQPISQRQPGVGATPMTMSDVADMQRMNAIRNQIAANTGILANLPEGIDPTQVGSIQGSGGGLQSVFNMQDFVDRNPGSIFPTGYNLGMLNNGFDTGLQFYGGDTAFGNTPQARAALEALRSTNPNQSFVNMLGGVGIGGLR
jgi:hypothetical protein